MEEERCRGSLDGVCRTRPKNLCRSAHQIVKLANNNIAIVCKIEQYQLSLKTITGVLSSSFLAELRRNGQYTDVLDQLTKKGYNITSVSSTDALMITHLYKKDTPRY